MNFFAGKFNKRVQDITAVDLDAMGSPCVRLKQYGDKATVVSADVLAPVDFSAGAGEKHAAFALPRHLSAKQAAIAVSTRAAVIKLISHPGHVDAEFESRIRDYMGLDDGDFRIGYTVVSQGHGRSETRVLTAAIPENAARAAIKMFSGAPAPFSLEASGAAIVGAFATGRGKSFKEESVGMAECGADSSVMAFFNKGELSLLRKLDFGFCDVSARVEKDLGVDRATASQIISDGAFDISQSVHETVEQFVKQLVISRHFVERRENCRISRFFLFGAAAASKDWANEVKAAMGFDVEAWDPFSIPEVEVAEGALSEAADKTRFRFAAAMGAGLGALGQS